MISQTPTFMCIRSTFLAWAQEMLKARLSPILNAGKLIWRGEMQNKFSARFSIAAGCLERKEFPPL